MKSYTYFILASSEDLVKIGTSTDPLSRFRTLSTQSPVPLQLLGVTSQSEASLHKRFDKYRAHGEWFYFPGEVCEFVYSKQVLRPRRNIISTKGTLKDISFGFDWKKYIYKTEDRRNRKQKPEPKLKRKTLSELEYEAGLRATTRITDVLQGYKQRCNAYLSEAVS